MKRLLQFLVFAPTAIVLIALSVANRGPVTIILDPFNQEDPALQFAVPLYWVLFAGLVVGALIGGFAVWMKQGRFRKEAREQKFAAALARNEVKKTQERVDMLTKTPSLPSPRS
ncbi:MAG: LapA family protein [Pseudomonadota bacterium]